MGQWSLKKGYSMDIGYKQDGKYYKLVVGKSREKDLPEVFYVQLYAYDKDFTSRKMVVNACVDSVDILWEGKDGD